MSDHQKEADDRLAQLLAAEALAAEEAEAFSDPDEPLPPHVKVTRGRTFDDLLRERPGNPQRRAEFKAQMLAEQVAERERQIDRGPLE